MSIEPGLVVTVRHYSLLNVFKSLVLETRDHFITLKLAKEFSVNRFLIGDPLVVAYMSGDLIKVAGGRLTALKPESEQLEYMEDVLESEAKNRLYERHPVSHYAYFRLHDSGRKCQALVKDISHYGIQIFTNEDLHRGQKMDIDIFLLRDIMTLKAEIVRKHQGSEYMEYGLKILHSGPMAYNQIVNYLRKSQIEFAIRFNKE